MRWLLASLFISTMVQITGCGSGSKSADEGMGDTGVTIGTGGIDGGQGSGKTFSDASVGGNTGAGGTGAAGATPAGGSTATTVATTKALVPDAGPDTSIGGTTGTGGTGAAGATTAGGSTAATVATTKALVPDAGADTSIGGTTSAGGKSSAGATSAGGSTAATGGTTKVGVPDAGPEARPDAGSSTPDGSLEESVYFSYGQAQGLFTGYGWVELGKADSLSSPFCSNGQPITHDKPCNASTVWSRDDALCITGLIPALPASPAQIDYVDNWGVMVGVNAAEPSDAVGDKLAGTKTVTFTLSGSPKNGVRAILHRKGDPDGVTYCYDSIKSDAPIKLSKFNTKCWGDVTTVFLTEDDLPLIDEVAIDVLSSNIAITVTDLCLIRLTFAK